MSGFIIMERDALEHPLLRDPARFYAWFWMIARACWKPTRYDIGGRLVLLDRGQFSTSVRTMADTWGWPKSNVDRFLRRLKSEGMIGTENGTGRLVITILNYDKYQSRDEDAGTANGTPKEAELQADLHEIDPNATRSTPDQKPGQQRDTANPQKTAENDRAENGEWDSSGTAAGQQRDIKEQGNKGTSYISPNGDCASDDALKVEHIAEYWNEIATRIWRERRIRDVTPARRQLVNARIAQYSLDDFATVFANVERSPFLRGERKWNGATFDWLMKRANFQKVLEGNYDD